MPEPPPPPPTLLRDSGPDGYFGRRAGFVDWLLALLLAAAAFMAVTQSYGGYGHSWDEALYFKPAQAAAEWVARLALGDFSLLSRNELDAHWGTRVDGNDPLHPEVAPVPKVLTGLGALFLTDITGDVMKAMRVPVAGAFAATVLLLYLLAFRCYGRAGAAATAVCYAMMPRVFGHAHIAASETLLAFAVVFTVWAFLAGITWLPAAVVAAAALALALNTKVTAVVIPAVLLLWGLLYYRRRISAHLFCFLFVTPLVVAATWPFLWHNGLERLIEYGRFYLGHQKTAVFYMGRVWGYTYGEPAPWHYPLVTTALALPEWVFLLTGIGLIRALSEFLRRPVPVLFLLCAAAVIGLASLPAAPKYDGERLFFHAFPFLALLAGGGFATLAGALPPYGSSATERTSRGWAAAFVLTLLAGWGAADLVLSHPNHLNFYNRAIGGSGGAYERGFETCYWGEALNEDVIGWLHDHAPPQAQIKTLALNELALTNLQQMGKLRGDLRIASGETDPDYFLLQVRQGFMGRAERALHLGQRPLKRFEAQGVPRIEVFAGDALSTGPRKTDKVTTSVPPTDLATTAPDTITTGSVETAATTQSAVPANPDADVELPAETSPTTPTVEPPASGLPPVDPSRLTVPRGVVPTPTAVPAAPRATTQTGEIKIDFLHQRRP